MCNIIQKQRCPSMTFIEEFFFSNPLCSHSAINILESCRYWWYQCAGTMKFDLSFSCKSSEKPAWKYQWLKSHTTMGACKSESFIGVSKLTSLLLYCYDLNIKCAHQDIWIGN